MELEVGKGAGAVVSRLRQATGDAHRRIEDRLDAVSQLSDAIRRPTVLARYAALYKSALSALARDLERVEGLNFERRLQAWHVAGMNATAPATPAFPKPADQSEALGALYVVEGSTLGGRIILRQLRVRGIDDPELSVLDPYGGASGNMWRGLLAVLEREGSGAPDCLDSMCRGAKRGFLHAERVLCGDFR